MTYFADVRRLARHLLPLLAAAQLLLAVPAMASVQVNADAAVPCDHMVMTGDHDCPCCPDGTESMKDCLTSCLLAALITSDVAPAIAMTHMPAEYVDAEIRIPSPADPPVKPPPIA
jgi:hypothetical protein